MSAAVEDLSDTFTNVIRNFGTVIGLSIAITAAAAVIPVILQTQAIVKGVLPK